MKNEKKEEEYLDFLSRAQRYCSLSEKCKYDLTKKLNEWKVPAPLHKKIILNLEKENFINEQRFAIAFARDKFRFSKWGKIKISYALKEKKLASNLISSALSEIDQKEYLEFCMKETRSKYASIKGKELYERIAKTLRYMAGKGFETDLCRKYIDVAE